MDDFELIRCNACRGRKMIEKLGGVLGECNTCKGSGKIKAADKTKIKADNIDAACEVVPVSENYVEIIDAVAQASPSQIEPAVDIVKTTKVKRAVFKRKKE